MAGGEMAKFLVKYSGANEEEVEADRMEDQKTWLVFYDDAGVSTIDPPIEILRIKAASVRRVERLVD